MYFRWNPLNLINKGYVRKTDDVFENVSVISISHTDQIQRKNLTSFRPFFPHPPIWQIFWLCWRLLLFSRRLTIVINFYLFNYIVYTAPFLDSAIIRWWTWSSPGGSSRAGPTWSWTSTTSIWPFCWWMRSKSTTEIARLQCLSATILIGSCATCATGRRSMSTICTILCRWPRKLAVGTNFPPSMSANTGFLRLCDTSTSDRQT